MLFTLVLFFVLTSCLSQESAGNNVRLAAGKIFVSPFIWIKDSSNGFIEPHAAMLVPVQLPNCSQQLYMQFDMGAPKTVLYKQILQGLGSYYPAMKKIADTAGSWENISINLGKETVELLKVNFINRGEKTINRSDKAINIVGTIGSDWLYNRVVLIDYPKREIVWNYTVAEQLQHKMMDFSYVQNNIILSVNIRGKKTMLFFDSGSSAFSLLTSKDTAEAMAVKGALVKRYPVSSWGRTMYANSLPTADSVYIGAYRIPLGEVTYMEGASESQVNRMLKLGIGGMTGNKLFLSTGLLLDTKNKKFMLLYASE